MKIKVDKQLYFIFLRTMSHKKVQLPVWKTLEDLLKKGGVMLILFDMKKLN